MTILLLRANHANMYELQNYLPLVKKHDIRVVTSHHSLTPITLPTVSIWSPTDLPGFPYRRQIFNRLIGGEQWLFGLNSLVSRYHVSKHSNKKLTIHTAETYTPYTHQAIQLRKKGQIDKLVCTCWETIPHNNEKFARLRKWKQEAFHYVDIFHTPTQLAKQALIKEGVDAGKIVVIPYGVDQSIFTNSGSKIPIPERIKSKKPIILTAGRKVPEKGYRLWQQLSHQLSGIADFRWVSGVPYGQMAKIYRQADIFLHLACSTPTWEEQYGMVLVEAMSCGLPVIATRSGAIPEVVCTAGIIVKENDLKSTKLAITQLISSPQLKHQLSRLALSRATRLYNAKKIATKLEKIY